MDRTLTDLLSELSSRLLASSAAFEPFVPNSHGDILTNLELLNGLGEITEKSLQEFDTEREVEEKKKISAATLSASKKAVQTPPMGHRLPRKIEYQPALKDSEVLQALLDLKNSNRLTRLRKP